MRLWFGILVVMTIATRAAFTGATPDAPPRIPGFQLTAPPAGGWTWPLTDPRAVEHDGVLYFGYIRGSDGSVVVESWNVATRVRIAQTVLSLALEVDDHDNPSILIRSSDERLMVFYSKHTETTLRYKVSTNPKDASAFGSEQTVSNLVAGAHTYTAPVQLSGDESQDIRLFSRTHVNADSGDPEMTYNGTSDDGATWSAGVRLHDLVYTKIAQTATQIHFAVSDHPGDGPTSIYHFILDVGDPAIRKSDGTALVSPTFPVQASSMTLVYDGSSTKAWVQDIAIDPDTGRPVIVFSTFPGNDGSDHRYQYARWTGSAWNVHQIVAAGSTIATDLDFNADQIYYSGGIALDQSDPSIVYASIEDGDDFTMYRYVTSDGGTTWSSTRLSSGTGVKHIRPTGVRGASGPMRVLWMAADDYTSYINYSAGTWASP